MSGLLVYVVRDDKMFGRRGVSFDAIGEIDFCLLDQVGRVKIVIVCIDIKIRLWCSSVRLRVRKKTVQQSTYNVISQTSHISFTPTWCIAAAVWRPHIGREEPYNIPDRHLVLEHLGSSLRGGDFAQILVSPRMARDLVALRQHSPDDCGVDRAWIVNLSLPVVVGGDEEGRFGAV